MIGSSEVRNRVRIVGLLLMLMIVRVMVSIVSGGMVLLMLNICIRCLVWVCMLGWLSRMLVGMLISRVVVIELKISIRWVCK